MNKHSTAKKRKRLYVRKKYGYQHFPTKFKLNYKPRDDIALIVKESNKNGFEISPLTLMKINK